MAKLVLETDDFVVVEEDNDFLYLLKKNSRVMEFGTDYDISEGKAEIRSGRGNIYYVYLAGIRWIRGEHVEQPPDELKRRVTAEEL